MVVHSGIAESGHYYSYIKKGDQWYEFNDSVVKEVIINEKITFEEWFSTPQSEHMFTEVNIDWPTNRKNAYMLFYKRREIK